MPLGSWVSDRAQARAFYTGRLLYVLLDNGRFAPALVARGMKCLKGHGPSYKTPAASDNFWGSANR